MTHITAPWIQRNQDDESSRAAAIDLLEACEALCDAIKLMGGLACDQRFDGPSLEFIEEHWQDYVPICQPEAYRLGQAAISKAKAEIKEAM